MAIYKFTHPSGVVRIVAAPEGDEARAREIAAGRGKERDDSYVGHDGGVTFELLRDTRDGVLLEYADPSAKAAEPPKAEKAKE